MRKHQGRWILDGFTVAMLFAMLIVILLYPLRMNRDAAVFIQFAMRLVEGQTMWADFYVVNFPMIFYISAVPVTVANLTGIAVPLAFQLYVWLIVGACAWISWFLVHRYYFDGEQQVVSSIFPAVIVGFSAYMLFHPDYNTMDFGQREHLFILLLIPGFIVRWLHWQQKSVPVILSILLGVLAAVGSVIKPQFLLLVALPELYWLAVHREWKPLLKPEVFAFGATGLLYGVWLLLMPGSDYFLGYMFPTFFPKYNSCEWYCETTLEMFQRQGIIVVMLLFALEWLVYRNRIPKHSFYSLLPALSVMRLAALLMNVQQQKGLHYRAVPMYLLMWVSLALLMAYLLGRRRANRIPIAWQYATTFVVLQMILIFNFVTVLGTISITDLPRAWSLPPDLDLYNVVVENSEPGDTVAFLTLDPALAHWMTLNTERRLLSRYSAEYPISFEYIGTSFQPGDEIPVLATVEDYVAALRTDIESDEPPLLVIEREREDRYPNIADILDSAGLPDDFAEQGYRLTEQVSGYDVWIRQ